MAKLTKKQREVLQLMAGGKPMLVIDPIGKERWQGQESVRWKCGGEYVSKRTVRSLHEKGLIGSVSGMELPLTPAGRRAVEPSSS
jgi:hypothetical protein